jgi:hypothetical protein
VLIILDTPYVLLTGSLTLTMPKCHLPILHTSTRLLVAQQQVIASIERSPSTQMTKGQLIAMKMMTMSLTLQSIQLPLLMVRVETPSQRKILILLKIEDT